MEAVELRKMKKDELEKKHQSLAQHLRELRFKKNKSELKNTAELKTVKKAIARVLTVLKEQENG
ncbi:MAG: 50S ribosomal protein L29 [Candidatus Margulisiibacteriota bacterium]|nr:50S ribosomal protein L29 [Candidatus Margulisiibacteriota bacterium]